MFKNALLRNIRRRSFYLWSFFFPFVLMCLFRLMFANLFDIENSMSDPVRVAVVTENADSSVAEGFDMMMEQISKGDDRIVDYNRDITGEDEAGEKIGTEIDAYYLLSGSDIKVVTDSDYSSGNTIEVNILRQVADSFMNEYSLLEEAMRTNPSLVEGIISDMSSSVSHTVYKSQVYKTQINTYNWYFYTTIVMGMIFNFSGGIAIVTGLRGDASETAKRLLVSPVNKFGVVIVNIACRLLPSCLITAALFGVVFLMGIPLSSNIPLIALFIVCGNLFTLAFGAAIAMLLKGTATDRINKTWGFIMLLVFLSGEMSAMMPAIVEKICPVINDINPVTVMNYALFNLTYSSDLRSFYTSMLYLTLASLVMMMLEALYVRRNSYASL
ncbi:MAG: ABC transporter permease [Saccharofermentans sp.]|nr:ABC transporter permease [Mageeibacillus sp.]MCI1264649.1 ABC transporter permease [Saccharofermentans sp.]MCI1274633.1 ABC transporter permease [Saccharofermentans sp.]MCI1768666.1 ABC transporter permease [Mageeibacillus sp.]